MVNSEKSRTSILAQLREISWGFQSERKVGFQKQSAYLQSLQRSTRWKQSKLTFSKEYVQKKTIKEFNKK